MSLLTVVPMVALAEGECEDDFTTCRDDCVIEYGGSARVEVKKRYDRCMKKCAKTASRCVERVTETKANRLDEGALDRAPGSDEVDEHNMPTRTSRGRSQSPKPTAEPGGEEDRTPSKRHDDLSEAEVPRSSRTTLKTDDERPGRLPDVAPSTRRSDEPKPTEEPKRAEEPKRVEEPKAEPPKRAEEPKVEPPKREEPLRFELKPRPVEDDLRDDGPRRPEPEREVLPPKKNEEKPKEPPRKREEDHDDLRNF